MRNRAMSAALTLVLAIAALVAVSAEAGSRSNHGRVPFAASDERQSGGRNGHHGDIDLMEQVRRLPPPQGSSLSRRVGTLWYPLTGCRIFEIRDVDENNPLIHRYA
jgi:hypothetical protein